MAIKKYYDSDCNLGVLDGKTVAIIGFGSQGHAHSENLAESGVNVVVGLRKGSAHWEKASEFAATHPNFKVMEVEEAAKAGDVVMMLVPDELCADIYNKQVAPYKGLSMDVPALNECWRTAPYLYDGRSYSMKDMLKVHGPHKPVTEKELEELEEYVLSL